MPLSGVRRVGTHGKFQAMPRGRHRHSQPLHRLLPPVAVAAVALACACGSWLVGEPGIGDPATVTLRGLCAAAAVAAVTGSVQARRWDRVAGKRVGELKARQASAEWRAEERQAELEDEAEQAREARTRAETQLRAKRTELARLRSEHADLLRRYAHAEADLASALEGRRQLELEAAEPSKALTSGATDHRDASGAPSALTYLQARDALRNLVRNAIRQRERAARERPVAEPDTRKPASAVVPARSFERERSGQGEAAREGAGWGAAAAADASREGAAETFDFFGKGAQDTGKGAPDTAAPRRERRRPAVPTPRGDKGSRAASTASTAGTAGRGGQQAEAADEEDGSGPGADSRTGTGQPASDQAATTPGATTPAATDQSTGSDDGDLDITELRSAI